MSASEIVVYAKTTVREIAEYAKATVSEIALYTGTSFYSRPITADLQ